MRLLKQLLAVAAVAIAGGQGVAAVGWDPALTLLQAVVYAYRRGLVT